MENRPPSTPTPSYDAQQVPVPDFGTFASTPAPEPQGLDAAWPEVPPGGWPEDHGDHPAEHAQYHTQDHFAQAVHDQVSPDQPNSPKVYISPKRKAILNESMDKASQLGLPDRSAPPQPTTYISMNPTRPANTKRNPRIGRFIFLLLVMNTLITAAAGAWIYNRLVTDIENRLADLASVNVTPPHGGANSTPGTPSPPPPASDDLNVVESRLENRLADVQAQLLATQKRLSEAELLNKQQTQSLKDLMENTANRAAIAGAPSASGAAGTGAAAAAPALSPSTQGELVLLKERNRLAGYADEAIATGARAPYDRLWEALDDPRLASLVHAARAEILRVQNYYLSGSRLDAYDIPVASYFPDSAALKDSQLKEDELVTLLANPKHPWQVRMKAANLIGLRRSKNAGDALVKAILEDQNLDVVKEASFSFEQMTGFRARLFEPASVKAWWDQYNSTAGGPAPAAAKK